MDLQTISIDVPCLPWQLCYQQVMLLMWSCSRHFCFCSDCLGCGHPWILRSEQYSSVQSCRFADSHLVEASFVICVKTCFFFLPPYLLLELCSNISGAVRANSVVKLNLHCEWWQYSCLNNCTNCYMKSCINGADMPHLAALAFSVELCASLQVPRSCPLLGCCQWHAYVCMLAHTKQGARFAALALADHLSHLCWQLPWRLHDSCDPAAYIPFACSINNGLLRANFRMHCMHMD